MESGGTALTMLLEAQVQSRDAAIGVGDAVNGEPPEEGIAAPALTEPVEATLGRVVKWVAAQIRVIATLQLAERAHRLEISGPPVNRAVQRGGATLAMLLEAHVDGGQIAAGVRDAIDGEPTRESIAPAPFSGPIEATLRRVVEQVALEVGVIPGLELRERARDLEVPGPRLVSADADAEVACACRHVNDGVRLRVVVGLPATDVIAGVALESHVVGSRGAVRPRASRVIPTARRCRQSEGKRHPAQRWHESHRSSPRERTAHRRAPSRRAAEGCLPNLRAGNFGRLAIIDDALDYHPALKTHASAAGAHER